MKYKNLLIGIVLFLSSFACSSCNSQILSIGQNFNPEIKEAKEVLFESMGSESPFTDRIVKSVNSDHIYLEVDSLGKYKLPYISYLISSLKNSNRNVKELMKEEINSFESFMSKTNTTYLYYVNEDCFYRDMKWDSVFDTYQTYHPIYETENGNMYFIERFSNSEESIEFKPDCTISLHLITKEGKELPLGYNFCKSNHLSNLENNPLLDRPCLKCENIEGRYFCCSTPWIAYKSSQNTKKSEVFVWNIETGKNFHFQIKGYISKIHPLKDGVIITNYVSKVYEKKFDNIHFQCNCDSGHIPEKNRFYTYYSFRTNQSYTISPPSPESSLQTNDNSNVIVWKNCAENTIYFQIPSINLSLIPFKFVNKMNNYLDSDCIISGNDGSWWFICDSIFNVKEIDGLLYVNKCDIPFSLNGFNVSSFTDEENNLVLITQRNSYQNLSAHNSKKDSNSNSNTINKSLQNPFEFSFNNPNNPVLYSISPENLKEIRKHLCNSYEDLHIDSIDKVIFSRKNVTVLGTKSHAYFDFPAEKWGIDKTSNLYSFLANNKEPINSLVRFTLQ